MKIRFIAVAAGLTAAVVAGSLLVAGVNTAAATSTPPWEPDTVGSVGSLTFYDASGNVVTGGSVTSHPFVKYAVASTVTPDTGLDAKAYLAIATPDGTNQTYNWSSDHLSSRTAYPDAADPASVRAGGYPYATSTASDFSLTDFFGDFPNTQTGPEAGLYQVRLYTTSTSAQGSGKYFSADISVSTSDPNATSGTWQVVYPAVVTPTVATAISTPVATPPSPAAHGSKVSLSATVTATNSSVPAGAVHFFDGNIDLGSATYDGTTGVATLGSLSPTDGNHAYTARFIPTDAASYAASTSTALAYVVSAGPADDTATSLAISPATSGSTSTALQFTATVTDTTVPGTVPTGSVQFMDSGTPLATAIAANGVAYAVRAPSTLSIGNHTFTATFVPSGNFNTTTSMGVAYSVTLPAPTVLSAPTAVGVARVGGSLTCAAGVWSYAGVYSYEWFLDSSITPFNKSAATGALPASYYKHQIKCTVTASNPSGLSMSNTAQVGVAAGAASVAKALPRILGSAVVGRSLTAYRGVWSPAASSYTYTWKRGAVIVSHAANYRVAKADKGKILMLVVVAVRTGYLSGTSASLGVKVH
jgi:hypothetical protein